MSTVPWHKDLPLPGPAQEPTSKHVSMGTPLLWDPCLESLKGRHLSLWSFLFTLPPA